MLDIRSAEWSELLLMLESDPEEPSAARNTSPAWVELGERIARLASVFIQRYDAWSVDADDVVQDVLLRLQAPGAIRRVRLAGSPQGYLGVVVRNRVLDELRRNRMRWRGDSVSQEWNDPEIMPTTDAGIDLQNLLATLTEDEQELIRLRFWEGYSIRDIADHLGVRYSTASVRLFRLLHKLREQFGD
jgi:RNA polymerase sigma-70 factor (ECF subfamily)